MMPCQCASEVTMGGYQNQELLEIPPHMANYRAARIADGLSGTIAVDRCILPEIQALWEEGIQTLGCCCGHHVAPPYVNTRPEDFDAMIALGYQPIGDRLDAFRSNSITPP